MCNLKISLIFFASLLFVFSCDKKEDTMDCSTIDSAQNTYTKSIKSIMDASCATSGCHTQNARAGGITLSTYESVKTNFVNGKGLCSVKHTCNPMPINGSKLSSDVIKKLECWVSSGTPE